MGPPGAPSAAPQKERERKRRGRRERRKRREPIQYNIWQQWFDSPWASCICCASDQTEIRCSACATSLLQCLRGYGRRESHVYQPSDVGICGGLCIYFLESLVPSLLQLRRSYMARKLFRGELTELVQRWHCPSGPLSPIRLFLEGEHTHTP